MHEEKKGERIEKVTRDGKTFDEPKVVDQWKCPNCNAWVDLDKCEWIRIPLDAGSAVYGEIKKDSMEPVEKTLRCPHCGKDTLHVINPDGTKTCFTCGRRY